MIQQYSVYVSSISLFQGFIHYSDQLIDLNSEQETMSDYYLVITSWPDFEEASLMARTWLDKKLVASVNILPKMHSIYLWKGESRTGTEHQMLLKTTAEKVEQLEKEIHRNHPYPLVEILRVAIDSGNQDYLNWISKVTR